MTQPSVSATNSSGVWRNADISITLTATDTYLSIAKYRWDNADCWNGTSYSHGLGITQNTQ